VVDERLLGGEDGEASAEAVGGNEEVDGLGPVKEVIGEEDGVLILPPVDHALVGGDEGIDIRLAQALLGVGADLEVDTALADDGGLAADGSSGSRGREGQGGEGAEETHLGDY